MSDLKRVPEYVTVDKYSPNPRFYEILWGEVALSELSPEEAQSVIDLLVERDEKNAALESLTDFLLGSILTTNSEVSEVIRKHQGDFFTDLNAIINANEGGDDT